MELLKKIEKSIVVVHKSCNEKYVVGFNDRKVIVLETDTDSLVFEQKVGAGTSACFSGDNRHLFIFSFPTLEVKIIRMDTWERERIINLDMLKKGIDKDHLGEIYPWETAFV